MRLRRITLSGFKTFAARSEVLFDPGITAIVGPNGSGKSNLVDAVRWALGETNARELRGQRMDEVIYAGGGGRQRMGLAQVELVIDNEEGTLPSEDPEVSVSRRVARGRPRHRVPDQRRPRPASRSRAAARRHRASPRTATRSWCRTISTGSSRRPRVSAGRWSSRPPACERCALRARRRRTGWTAPTSIVRRLTDLLDDATPRLAELSEQSVAAIELRTMSLRLTELRGSLAHEEWRAARASLKLARRRVEQALGRCEAASEADAAFTHRSEVARQRLDAARAARDAAARRLEDARIQVERGEGSSVGSRTGSAPRSPSAGSRWPTSTRSRPKCAAAPRRSPPSMPATSSAPGRPLEREADRLRLAATEAAAEAEIEEERFAAAAAALAECRERAGGGRRGDWRGGGPRRTGHSRRTDARPRIRDGSSAHRRARAPLIAHHATAANRARGAGSADGRQGRRGARRRRYRLGGRQCSRASGARRCG